LRRHRARRLVVLDIPLLFEKRYARNVDMIAVVSAPSWQQRRRVLARPGMTVAKFQHILSLQLPDRIKRQRADFIIPTGVSRDVTHREIRRLIACLVTKQGRYSKI
jgi:dephospho-CoA kinase